LVIISAPPYSVSSDFGQLAAMRHLISGADWAIAGAAMAAAPATPAPVTLIKSRRFIDYSLGDVRRQPSCRGLRAPWSIRFRISMTIWDIATKKPGLGEGRAWFYDLRLIPIPGIRAPSFV
jgi:hypothetical protein